MTNKKRLHVVLKSGTRIDLHNVTLLSQADTERWLRVRSDEGMSHINPNEVEYYLMKYDQTGYEQESGNAKAL